MPLSYMSDEDCRSEKRKCLKEIGGSSIYAPGCAFERGHLLLSIAGCPSVAVLEADEMRRRYEVNNAEDDAERQHVEFGRHRGS